METTPSKVGHVVSYNTEDVEATNFGVPEQADGRETDDDEITLNPDDFHPGGHGSAVGDLNKPTTATSAHSGAGEPLASRPPEPSRIPRDLKTPGEGRSEGRGKAGATPSQPMSNAMSGAAVPDDPSNPAMVYTQALPTTGKASMTSAEMASDNTDRDEEPGYAENEGQDSDADDVISGSNVYADAPATAILHPAGSGPASASGVVNGAHGVSGAHGRNQPDAQATRKGARISAESRDAVHGMRDGAVSNAKLACEHCGCPQCQSLLAVMNGGMLDALGQHATSADESADTKSDTAMFGELRATRASINARVTRELAELRAQMAEFTDALSTALGDLQLTLADHSRGYAAQTTRAVNAQIASLNAQLATALPDMVTRMSAAAHTELQPAVQRLEVLAASVAEVKAGVERMEMQPMPQVVAPSLAIADKRSPLDTPTRGGASSDEIAFLTNLGRQSTDQRVQTEIGTRLTTLANRR
jgi:hypothetical protein